MLELYWMSLEMHFGSIWYIQVNEYDCHLFEGDTDNLAPAELVQDEYDLSTIEGRLIISDVIRDDDFAVLLDNGLCFICEGGPGGNYPVIFNPNDEGA
jgi:hypothetical protein